MAGLTLPLDIIFQILLTLQVKTLCRFRCVSKSWYALISDPIFRQSHYNQSKNNPLLLRVSFDCDTDGCKKLHFVAHDKEKNLITKFEKTKPPYLNTFLSTCEDLACMNDHKKVYLLNPTTEDLIALPESNFQDKECYYLRNAYIGWLHSSNEYKVLSIFQRYGHAKKEVPLWHCEILGLASTGTITNHSNWKAVGRPPLRSLRLWNAGTSVNGSIYVLPDYTERSYNYCIARFDLEHEEWSTLSPPAPPNNIFQIWTFMLGQRDSLLCLVQHCSRSRLNLWFLNDCNANNGWVQKQSININMSDLHKAMLALPLATEEDGRLLMDVYFMDTHRKNMIRKLQHYDLKSRMFTEINTAGKKGQEYYTCGFYVESFMPLGTR